MIQKYRARCKKVRIPWTTLNYFETEAVRVDVLWPATARALRFLRALRVLPGAPHVYGGSLSARGTTVACGACGATHTTHEEHKSFPFPRQSDELDRGRQLDAPQGVSPMATPPTVHPSPIDSSALGSSSDTLQVPSPYFLPAERHQRKAPSVDHRVDPLQGVLFSTRRNDPLSNLLRHKRVRVSATSNDEHPEYPICPLQVRLQIIIRA